MSLATALYAQFGRPSGFLGRVAGTIMATRPSNRARNAWTIELLDIGPEDRVVELGCGPGLGLEHAAARAVRGLVVGIDHSSVMLDQARRRNRAAVEAVRLLLLEGSLERLVEQAPFDKAFSLNVIQFLPDRTAALRAFRDVLRPGGLVATTYQPRHRGATAVDARRMAEDLQERMRAAGFVDIGAHELPLEPTPAVAVTGRRPPG